MDSWRFLSRIEIVKQWGEVPDQLTGISQDSRSIEPGFVFAARRGEKTDGLKYLPQAIDRGAVLIMCEDDIPEDIAIPAMRVEDFREALVRMSHEINDNPADKLQVIGITGTNGKTSTTYYLQSILNAAGLRCGRIGTLGYDDGVETIKAGMTTPDIDMLCGIFSRMLKNGCEHVVMEVSSHGLRLGRVAGIRFSGAGFTNLSQDHLDFHRDMNDYAEAKAILFKDLDNNTVAVINIDDEYGDYMASVSSAEIRSFSRINDEAFVRVVSLKQEVTGSKFEIRAKGERFNVETSLVGDYQGDNIGLATAMALSLGLTIENIQTGIQNLRNVPGRLESIDRGQSFSVFVDYAHTPDALYAALKTLRPLCRGGLTVVFGCGGDRDRAKRPIMGAKAAEIADRVIITNDNPRSEKPETIAGDIIAGIRENNRHKVSVELDRFSAIEEALTTAETDDVIVIAGKGAESEQLIGDQKLEFDDRIVAAGILDTMANDLAVI